MIKSLIFKITLLLLVNSSFSQAPDWTKFNILHYKINLNLSNLSTKSIQGSTEVLFTVRSQAADTLFLQLAGLNIDSMIYLGQNINFTHTNQILTIPLNDTVNFNDTALIKIYYSGIPIIDGSGFGGFYFSSDNNFAYNLGVAINGVPPGFGRSWFPCIDSFTDKAKFDLRVTTTYPQFAVSGGELVTKQHNLVNNTLNTHWKIEQEIPTYLMSVAVADFTKISKQFVDNNNVAVPVEIYVRSADSANAIVSFQNVIEILEIFEDKFGAYKWPRVGFSGIPFNGGAMEHAMNVAYPIFAINGNLQYEDLLAHEIAHSWFGNLVTCATASEMWINEGWAVFAEFVYLEELYGTKIAQNYIRQKRQNVIQRAHLLDNGFHAIHGVPQQNTYSTTVYDKGGLVVNALRHYMTDSLFFATVRNYLQTYSFNSISSHELRDFFSLDSGIDLTDFFDAWVFRPGFSTFVVDSFHIQRICARQKVTVFINQKLRGTNKLAKNNKFDLMFLSKDNQIYTERVTLPNYTGSVEVMLLFEPQAILVDPLDKNVFATTKYDSIIRGNGQHLFNDAFFRLNAGNLAASDSIILFLSHHWVEPDNNICPNSNIYRISTGRYWEIAANFIETATFGGSFQYNRSASSGLNDHLLLRTTNSVDSLVLLYRKDASECWRIFPFQRTGSANIGFLNTTYLPQGQYTFGIAEPFQSSTNDLDSENSSKLNIYPNPSSDYFTIELKSYLVNHELFIFDNQGKPILQSSLNANQDKFIWKPANIPSGVYFIQLYDSVNRKFVETKKVIYTKL